MIRGVCSYTLHGSTMLEPLRAPRFPAEHTLPFMRSESPRSLRRAYLDWVEEQVETYKEEVSRSELMRMAEEAIAELRVTDRGQYQLTELLLCAAIDKRIARLLKLPGYRAWSAKRLALQNAPLFPPDLVPPPPVAAAPAEKQPRALPQPGTVVPLVCVV